MCVENPYDQIVSAHINENAISKLTKDAIWLKILISEAKFTADASSKIKGTALEKDLLSVIFGDIEEPGSTDKNTKEPESSDEDNEESESFDNEKQ